MTKLRKYQKVGVKKIEHFKGRVLLADEMGLGKTIQALRWAKLHPEKWPIIVVCPATLKWEWQAQAAKHINMRGVIAEGTKPPKHIPKILPMLILNYDILQYWVDYLKTLKPQILIIDECFPCQTPILTEKGYIQIGDIVENKLDVKIKSYNFSKKIVNFKPILHYIKKQKPKQLIKIQHQYGYLECTPEHKIWEEKSNEYKKAEDLQIGDNLLLLQKEVLDIQSPKTNKKILFTSLCNKGPEKAKAFDNKNLQMVPQKIQILIKRKNQQQTTKILQQKLLSQMENEPTGNQEKDIHKREGPKSQCNQEKMVFNQSRYRIPKTCFQKNEENESKPLLQKKDDGNSQQKKRTKLDRQKGRERIYNRPPTITTSMAQTSNGICNKNCQSKSSIQMSPLLLQNRFGNTEKENSHRSRWGKPQNKKAKIYRPQKNRSLIRSRVEGVEILEQRSNGRNGKDNQNNKTVYDLEVANNHNYFANNILVSNCHYIKNRRAKRTKAIKQLAKTIPHIIAIGGTPLVNRPSELFTTLQILHPKTYTSFFAFATRYCNLKRTYWGWEYKGATNLNELHQILNSTMMIRRLKKNVLKELPDKIRHTIPIPIRRRSEYELAVKDFLKWLTKKSSIKAKRAAKAQQLTQIGYLKRLAAELKMKYVIRWIDDFLERNEGKLVLYAVHKKIIKRLHKKYKGISVIVDGSVIGKKRMMLIQKFQHNKKIRLFIGNIKAAGVGITLTSAYTLAFVEMNWVPAEHTQAEDRIHRIGQKNVVSIYYLIAKNTIEEDLCKLIQKKQKVLSNILDGKSKTNELNIFDKLEKALKKGFKNVKSKKNQCRKSQINNVSANSNRH